MFVNDANGEKKKCVKYLVIRSCRETGEKWKRRKKQPNTHKFLFLVNRFACILYMLTANDHKHWNRTDFCFVLNADKPSRKKRTKKKLQSTLRTIVRN